MKITKIAIAALVALSFTATAQNGDEIIKKHIDAIGGEANWNKVKSLKLTGTMNMQGMEIPMTRTVVDGKGVRIEFDVMGSSNYMIVTPNGGWSFMPIQGMDKPTAMPEEQVKQMAKQLTIKNTVLADRAQIGKAEYAGMDTLEKTPCYKVKITNKDGLSNTCYFDANNYYMVRVETRANVNGEEQEVGMTFSNFQRQPEGVVLAMTETLPGGMEQNHKSVEINKPVKDDLFVVEAEKK
ncbi:MAG: hypothetical protein KF744_06350 [Taibaiella sp.]|nr:hypothetical protein [Taibaiella sp.]